MVLELVSLLNCLQDLLLKALDGICKAKCHSNYTTPDFCP